MSKPKAEFRETRLVVVGSHRFPLDMLRYDSCVPMSATDAVEIERSLTDSRRRVINLRRFSYDGTAAEFDRWLSYGWRVEEDTGRKG